MVIVVVGPESTGRRKKEKGKIKKEKGVGSPESRVEGAPNAEHVIFLGRDGPLGRHRA